jgi:hypothetical protein
MYKIAFFPGSSEAPSAIPLFGPADQMFEKVAAPSLLPDVTKYIERLCPEPDSQYVLVNAMGAGEYYSSNINGDYFPEAALVHMPDGWTGEPDLDRELSKTWPYGSPTFYRAYPYAHHRNKNPATAFGNVELVAWNPRMHRVELVIRVDRQKCLVHGGETVWDKLKAGLFPDVSMGCRVPFDLCSVCGDLDLYERARLTFDPKIHAHPGRAILEFHKKLKAEDGLGIRGVAVTRKDYCFPPGTPVLTPGGQYQSIEKLCEDDLVISHTGESRRVISTMRREVDEDLVAIRVWGLGYLIATEEHPLLVADLPKCKYGRVAHLNAGAQSEWVPIEDVRIGNTVFMPIPAIDDDQTLDRDLGWLLGMYIAEGCIMFSGKRARPKGVDFTVSSNERVLLERLEFVCRTIDEELTCTYYEYKNRNAVSLRLTSQTVAEWLLLHGGRGSHTKVLHPNVWSYGSGFARGVLRGWSDGDGSIDKNKDLLRVVTSSDVLAHQMQLLAAGVGVLGALILYERDTNYCHQSIWYLSFSGDAACAILEERAQTVFAQQSKLFMWKNYLCSTVRSVDRVPYAGPVFNLEVEEDNSYVAGSLAVHNCDHATHMMNKILSNGIKVWVVNDYPDFFDISFVFIGAEKTAKAMMKIASSVYYRLSAETAELFGYTDDTQMVKAASVSSFEDFLLKDALAKKAKTKGAEIIKDVVPSQLAGKAVPLITGQEPDLPKTLVDLMSKLPLEEALGTPSSMGIILKPKEFQRMMLSKLGLSDEADRLEEQNVLFPKVDSDERMDVDLSSISPILSKMLSKFVGDRSLYGPSVEKRVTVIIMSKPKDRSTSSPSELLRKIGSAYSGYRRSLVEMLPTHTQTEVPGCKTASVSALFTPLSTAYLKDAYWDEVGTPKEALATADVERGFPSKNTRAW